MESKQQQEWRELLKKSCAQRNGSSEGTEPPTHLNTVLDMVLQASRVLNRPPPELDSNIPELDKSDN